MPVVIHGPRFNRRVTFDTAALALRPGRSVGGSSYVVRQRRGKP